MLVPEQVAAGAPNLALMGLRRRLGPLPLGAKGQGNEAAVGLGEGPLGLMRGARETCRR